MSTKFHVFLSHNSTDKPAVEELARRLKEEGIESWLDKWHLIPGEEWQPAIEQALTDSGSVAVFVGPSGFGPWQNEEMRAALARRVGQSDGKFRVIPVLLPGGTREERSRLPTFLVASTWVEFRKSMDEEESYHRLRAGILGQAPGAEPGESKYEGQCPYRGLQAFQPEHAPFFFGREARIEWLLNTLRPASTSDAANPRRENRFLGIIGASGSGKSSLARAGLVPALRHGRLEGSDSWPIVICRPGQDPLESLAVALAADPTAGTRIGDVGDLITRMESDETRLHLTTRLALANAPESQRIVLVIDQFEEVFTLQSDIVGSIRSSRSFRDLSIVRTGDVRRKAFIDNLIYASGIPGGKTVVVLTMRADFYGKCASFPNLAAALTDHQELVGPMTPNELREVIERPAQLVGLELERGLVEMLLREMEDQPGALPLLQHALWELWQRREGRRLTVAAYQAIGGLEGALEKQANEIFDGLNPADQETCRRIFLRLTQPGEGSEDTKRRVALSQLGDSAAVTSVIQRLTNVRLITAEGQANRQTEAFVEVSHEALIRSWSKLRTWIDSDREALRTMHRLSEASAEWIGAKRDPGYLFHGARLAEAEEWSKTAEADLNVEEREFLTAGIEARDREKRLDEERRVRELENANKLAESERQRAHEQSVAARRSKVKSIGAMVLAAMAVVASVWAFRAERDAVGARQKIEETLAGNLLERIDPDPGPFGRNEFLALWQIAGLPPEHERLRALLLSKGIGTPEDAARLSNRAPQIAHSVVGLDSVRRDEVFKKVIVPTLKRTAAPLQIRLAAVRLGIALDFRGADFADQAVKTLAEALVDSGDARYHDGLTEDLKSVVRQIAPADMQRAADDLLSMMEKSSDTSVLDCLTAAIIALPGPVPLATERRVAERLVAVMEQQSEPDSVCQLNSSLASLPADPEIVDAIRVIKYLVATAENTGNPDTQDSLVKAVRATSKRLRPSECRSAADVIVKAMNDAQDSQSAQTFAQCLTSVAVRLALAEPAGGIEVLLAAMQTTRDAESLHVLATGLGEMSGRLTAQDGTVASSHLLSVLEKSKATRNMSLLAESLAAIPIPLTKEVVARATSLLLTQVREDALPPDLYEVCLGLAALPGPFSNQESQKVMTVLLNRINRATKTPSIVALGGAMRVIGRKLTQETSVAVTESILAAMVESRDTEKVLALSHAVVGIERFIDQATLEKFYHAVLAKIHDPLLFLPIDLSLLAKSLAVLPGMTPELVANSAIQKLLDALVSTENSDAVGYLVEGLGAVGGNISIEVGHQAINGILKSIRETRDTKLWRVLALGLASVSLELTKAEKFTPGDAAEVVIHLSWAIDVTTDSVGLQHLALGLATVAEKLPADSDPKAPRTAIEQILKSIQATRDPAVIGMLAHGWQAMAGRMTELETHLAFVQFLASNQDPANAAARPALCEAAVALALASDASHSPDALRHLLSALLRDGDTATREILLNGTLKLAPRIPASDVAQARLAVISLFGSRDRLNVRMLEGLIATLDALPGEVDLIELIELLKCPFCTGASRQMLLRMIETRTGLKFDGDVWKLVATANVPGVGPEILRRPAKRPEDLTTVIQAAEKSQGRTGGRGWTNGKPRS